MHLMWHHLGVNKEEKQNLDDMVLKMMLEGKLVGLTQVEPQRIKSKGYLQDLCEALRKKYKEALAKCIKPPTFLLEVPTNG